LKKSKVELQYRAAELTFSVQEKTQIREEIKRKRQRLGRFRKIILDGKIRSQIESFEPFQQASTILLYASMKGEVDTLKFIKKHHDKKRIILPTVCTDNNTLKLYHLENMRELHAGYQGILEIPHCTKDTAQPEDIDLCIVPGLAFDMQGNRIGYGKGFYDELLGKIDAPKAALAYDFQVYPQVPATKYDIPVSHIITPLKILGLRL